jgi:glucosyl-3-phosphoglycerate synthase
MEYVQEPIATLHDYGDASPTAPVDSATVVVPLTQQEYGSRATQRVFERLEMVAPEQVLVALRAESQHVGNIARWLESFDLPMQVLWCTAPRVERRLDELGLDGHAGKGRDVWLGLGLASESEYVVVHDADATSYDETDVPKLLSPLAGDHEFVKGYYARVENDRLYGRLYRQFYTPLVRALVAHHDADILTYLASFRYALAGEFATTGEVARRLRTPRGWGLEVGTLGDAFDAVGFSGTAQVDLGIHEHDHRSVDGSGGLGRMCAQVGRTLFNVAEDHGVEPEYDSLVDRYHESATTLVEQYAADARFNDLTYDPDEEHTQIDVYGETITPPTHDDRLPAWCEIQLDPDEIATLSTAAIEAQRDRDTPACSTER